MSIMERMQKLFPQCIITDDEIDWKGGAKRAGRTDAPYISGYRGQELVIDGSVTSEELEALAEWHRFDKRGEECI